MYKQILVAVDASKPSGLALKEAASLAKQHAANLRLAHVVDDTSGSTVLETPREMFERQAELRESGERILTYAAAAARTTGVGTDTVLLDSDGDGKRVYEAIEKEAERWPADLIVIGTHGRRGIKRLLQGSVAEGLVRVATKPVLLVRAE